MGKFRYSYLPMKENNLGHSPEQLFISNKKKARDRARIKRIIQRGLREAHRLGLRNGVVTAEYIYRHGPIVLRYWQRQTWSECSSGERILVAAWRPRHQTAVKPIVLRRFGSKLFANKGMHSTVNLIYFLVSKHQAIQSNFDALVDEVVRSPATKEKDLATALVALAADDLRVDLYDELKRYVVFGKVRDHHSLHQIFCQGLLWDDLTIPPEVRDYFMERHQFNPVEL